MGKERKQMAENQANGGSMTNEQADEILKELEMLRKLKMIELFDKGYSQAQLAQALGVSQPTISRMMPKVSTKRG
jgi:predicted XRE-type DNA-binding protein